MVDLQRPPIELVDQLGGAGQWFLDLSEYLRQWKWYLGSIQTVGNVTGILCSATLEPAKAYLLIGMVACSKDSYIWTETFGGRVIAALAGSYAGIAHHGYQADIYNGFTGFTNLDLDFYHAGTNMDISLQVRCTTLETINWKGGILALGSL